MEGGGYHGYLCMTCTSDDVWGTKKRKVSFVIYRTDFTSVRCWVSGLLIFMAVTKTVTLILNTFRNRKLAFNTSNIPAHNLAHLLITSCLMFQNYFPHFIFMSMTQYVAFRCHINVFIMIFWLFLKLNKGFVERLKCCLVTTLI